MSRFEVAFDLCLISKTEKIMNTDVPDIVGVSSSRLARIGTVTQSYVDQGKLPGAVTMIARRGQVVHAECFGMWSQYHFLD